MDPPSQSLRRDETTNCRQDRENSPTADERRYTQIGFRRPPITFHFSPFTVPLPPITTAPLQTPRSRTSWAAGFWAWVRLNGFVIGLFAAVIVAFIFPQPGARHGWLHPELISNFGIALILFLQGLSMPLEKVKRGAGNLRLHVIIQLFTFVVFPIVGLGFQLVVPHIWVNEPPGLQQGFLYLCVLPSTVSTSVVLTSVARGNTAAGILSAAFPIVLGVRLTR